MPTDAPGCGDDEPAAGDHEIIDLGEPPANASTRVDAHETKTGLDDGPAFDGHGSNRIDGQVQYDIAIDHSRTIGVRLRGMTTAALELVRWLYLVF